MSIFFFLSTVTSFLSSEQKAKNWKMELKSTLKKKSPFTNKNLSTTQPMKTTKDTIVEWFTYHATTSPTQKWNATPEISTLVTTTLQKCLLSNKIEKQNYPRRASMTLSTYTFSTNYTVANNGMKEMKGDNGVSAEVKGMSFSGRWRSSEHEKDEAMVLVIPFDYLCNIQ